MNVIDLKNIKTTITKYLVKFKPYRDIIYMIAIVVLCALWLNQCKKTSLNESAIIGLNDSIRVLVHKDGSRTFSTSVVSVDPSVFKKIKTDDVGIIALQKQVDKKTQSSTFIGASTNINGIYKDSTKISTLWMSGYLNRMSSDSIELNLDIKNDFIVTIREKGIFKPRVEVDVLAINPFTEIGVLKSYSKPLKTYSVVIGPQIGFGFGFNTTDLTFSPNYYIGLGATIPIIKL